MGQNIEIDYDIAMEIASHEALVRQAYKDGGGVWTWSIGLTSATGHNVTRYIDNPQSVQYCLDVYVWALQKYADRVRKAFKGYNLSRTEFTASLSFDWNTGKIDKASWVKLVKQGKVTEAKAAFMEWNKPASIIERRQAECDLFFNGKWHGNGTMIEYTKLTKNHTPVWSSAKRIDVENEMMDAFDAPADPVEHRDPQPNKHSPEVTLTPSAVEAEQAEIAKPSDPVYVQSFWSRLKAWFKRTFNAIWR